MHQMILHQYHQSTTRCKKSKKSQHRPPPATTPTTPQIDYKTLGIQLTNLLRHSAADPELQMQVSDIGHVKISEILQKIPTLQQFSHDNVIQLVESHDIKKRYRLSPCKNYIRATGGHSFKIAHDKIWKLLTIDDAKDMECIHGTTRKGYELIKLAGGLVPVKQTHIHFATALRGRDVRTISGMRKNPQIIIHIDLITAIESGIAFWLTETNAIMSSGNDDAQIIPIAVFSKVVDVSKQQE